MYNIHSCIVIALCFITDLKPTMPELTDFPGKTRHFNIAVRIGIKYLSFGTGLLNDESGDIVPSIVSEHRGNAEQINMDILSRWVQGKGIADRTWRGLLGVLRVHCPGLAQDIEETLRAETGTSDGEVESTVELESEAPTNTSSNLIKSTVKSFLSRLHIIKQPQPTLSRFSDGLRARYAKYPLPHHSNPQCRKWMPHMSYEYIHPDIIGKKELEEQPPFYKEAVLCGQRFRISTKDNNTPVQLEELLETRSGKNRNVILVEGGPGIGKSTLAWQVCHRWGKRELFDQYSTVLLLLRDERVQQAKRVKDLFFYLEDETVIVEIGTGRDILVILDGLDELPSHLLSKQSIFTDLLSGEVLGDATILVTSRPSATQQLLMCWKQRISKHFVICGFNNEDIEEYTKSILCGEKLTEFQSYLSIHPHIQSIMYVPLHSAIVMAVYLQHKQLPKILTQLYMTFAEMFLSQYLDDHPEYCGEEEITCAVGLELPKPVHARFLELCRIAFDTVCKQELIFTNKTMPKVLHDLGFTDSVPGLYMHRKCSYNFLHLSIQEFLAAYHISLLSPQEQEQLLLDSHFLKHYENMMRFVAGLTKFEGIRKEAIKQFVVRKWSEKKKHRYYLNSYGLELLYECQNVSILDTEEDTYTNCELLSSPSLIRLPSHHWLALGYCIANSKCTWEIHCYDADVIALQLLLQGLQDCEVTQPAYAIKSIDWVFSSGEVYRKLLDFATHTEIMSLSGFSNESDLTHFFQWLPTCHLKKLFLPGLQPYNIEMVSRALTAVLSLKTLDIKGSKFTLHSMQAFTPMLQQNQSLTKVDISYCKIDSDCACCLASALRSNTTLTVLDISGNSVGEVGALAMIEMLKKHNAILTVLKMSKNSLSECGALAMAEMLQHNTTLTVLNMDRNLVGQKGALAMAEMLKHNTTLKELDISNNSIGERGALAIAEMLKHNTTLAKLGMYDDTIGVEGVKALVENLAVNYHLKKLQISQKNIKTVEAISVYQANKERVCNYW